MTSPEPTALPIANREPRNGFGGWKVAGQVLRGMLLALALLAGIMGMAWLVLQWAILPRIEHWRPQVEQRATQALGMPVRIGAIEVTDAGSPWRWARAIELRDVVLYRAEASAAGGDPAAEALRLPSVRAALSPASLLPGWDGRWRLRFAQLLIDGAQLDVRREPDGRILVAGFEPRAGADDGSAADWFFSQNEIAIRNARLLWTDALRAAPPLALEGVDLVLRNGVRRHALRLDATPPPEWGARFSLRGEFTQPLIGGAPSGKPSLDLLARPGDWRRWRGTLYAELPEADIEPLRRQVDLPFDLARGSGALRAWVEIQRAAPVAATVDVALRDVALRLAPGADWLAFDRIDGRLSGRLGGRPESAGEAAALRSGELRAERFGFTTSDGLVWPAADLSVEWRLGADGALSGGALKAPRLDLGLLARAFARLPAPWVGAGLHDDVAALGAAGVATAVDARWEGPLGAPQRYAVKASVRALTLAARPVEAPASGSAVNDPAAAAPVHPGRPGVEGADIDFSATEAGGEARVSLADGALDLPGLFEPARIALGRLDGLLTWRIEPGQSGALPGLDVRAREVRFANADTQGEFDARWSRAAEAAASPAVVAPGANAPRKGAGLGRLDLKGRLGRAEATRVARYLPLGLPADVRHYVDRAVQGGQVAGIDFKVRGELRDFPFGPRPGAVAGAPEAIDKNSEFRLAAQLEGVRFAFLPGDAAWDGLAAASVPANRRPWPALTDVKGELVFDRQSMELRKMQARFGTVGRGGFELTRVRGGIRDLAHEATLVLEGSGRGPLVDALDFVNATPVGGWIGGALAQARSPYTALTPAQAGSAGVGSPIDLQLALDIPLRHAEQTTVRGNLVLSGNDLRLRPDLPLLANARARIAFTENHFALTAGAARLLGGEAAIDGATQPDGSLRFNVQGTASAEGLRASGLGALPRAAALMTGQTSYRLGLGFARGGQIDWLFNSTLAGLAIDLPAPWRKSAEQAMPLRVQLAAAPQANAATNTSRDLLRVDLGPEGARLLQAAWLRETGPQGTRVLRGGIGVQDAMPTMAEGVSAQVSVDRLDVDAWQRVAERLGAPGADAAIAAARAGDAEAGYLPANVSLKAQELDIGGRRLHRVLAAVSRGAGADDGTWQARIEATELQGSIEYRPPGARAADAAGRLQARLSRLALPKQEADAVSSLLDSASPTSLPALDITVDELELNGKRMGRVEIDAVNRVPEGAGSGMPGEWRLNKFRMLTPDSQLTASGVWAPAAGLTKRRAVIDFKLDISDGGALLTRMGQSEVLRGAKGQLSGQVNWLGSPLAIDHASLGGQVRVAVEGGQFLQAEPGIAKLLGVLSLQSLPRRLLLDFRDVFEQGFVFDSVAGDLDIAQGVANTRNLRMKGVQATVLMEGSADLARETQDLHVWVVPEINAGTASLAVAVINPAVGIGSFLAQLFLRRPLIEAGTREFRVTGPWVQPKVDRIERARTAPPSDDEPAPSTQPPKESR